MHGIKNMAEEVEQRIKSIFLKVFPTLKSEEFDIKKGADQYENWDSFSHMQLISEVEAMFNITLEVEEISRIDSAEKLIEIIKRK